MNENIYDKMHDLSNEYWVEFGQLVAKYIKQVPLEYRSNMLNRIEDLSSAHGSGYDKHLKFSGKELIKGKSYCIKFQGEDTYSSFNGIANYTGEQKDIDGLCFEFTVDESKEKFYFPLDSIFEFNIN